MYRDARTELREQVEKQTRGLWQRTTNFLIASVLVFTLDVAFSIGILVVIVQQLSQHGFGFLALTWIAALMALASLGGHFAPRILAAWEALEWGKAVGNRLSLNDDELDQAAIVLSLLPNDRRSLNHHSDVNPESLERVLRVLKAAYMVEEQGTRWVRCGRRGWSV